METAVIEDFATTFPDLAENANGIAHSRNGMRAYFMTLTPEMAKRILEFNTDNYRKVRPKHVDLLSREMASGTFLLNGDPIRIGSNSIVLDGQHRLYAVARLAPFTEVEFLIVDTVSPETLSTIDANALARSYIDHLRHLGFQNATNRSALVVLYHKWLNDRPLDSSYATSIAMLDAVHNPNSERITWAVQNSLSIARKIKGVQPAVINLAFLILGQISEIAIKQLLIGVAEGENIKRGMPAYTLRNRFQDDHDDNIKRLRAEQLHFIFRCFDIELKNTMRNASDQLTIHRLLPLPPQGISTRDLKNMLVTDR